MMTLCNTHTHSLTLTFFFLSLSLSLIHIPHCTPFPISSFFLFFCFSLYYHLCCYFLAFIILYLCLAVVNLSLPLYYFFLLCSKIFHKSQSFFWSLLLTLTFISSLFLFRFFFFFFLHFHLFRKVVMSLVCSFVGSKYYHDVVYLCRVRYLI